MVDFTPIPPTEYAESKAQNYEAPDPDTSFIDAASNFLEVMPKAWELGSYDSTSYAVNQIAATEELDMTGGSQYNPWLSPEEAQTKHGVKTNAMMSELSVINLKSENEDKQRKEQELYDTTTNLGGTAGAFLARGLSASVDPWDVMLDFVASKGVGNVMKMGAFKAPETFVGKFGKELGENLIGNSAAEIFTDFASKQRGEENDPMLNVVMGTVFGTALIGGTKAAFGKVVKNIGESFGIMKKYSDLGIDPTIPANIYIDHKIKQATITPEFETSLRNFFGEEKTNLLLKDADDMMSVKERILKEFGEDPVRMKELEEHVKLTDEEKAKWFNEDSDKLLAEVPDNIKNEMKAAISKELANDIPEANIRDEDIAPLTETEARSLSKEYDSSVEQSIDKGTLPAEDAKSYRDIQRQEVELEESNKVAEAIMNCTLKKGRNG